MPQINTALRFDLIQMRRLETLVALGVGVVQDPIVVAKVAEMAAGIEYASAYFLEDSCILVFE